MTNATSQTTAEDQIRQIMDDAAVAIRARDLDGSLSHHASDVVSFDVVNPLQFTGLDAVRERLNTWFSTFAGPIGFETRDLTIVAGDEAAFCHGLNHVSATTTNGSTLDMWWRATTCFRKIDGAWTIIHAHASVPFNTENGQASLGLTPGS